MSLFSNPELVEGSNVAGRPQWRLGAEGCSRSACLKQADYVGSFL